MQSNAVITGIGLLTPLGLSADATWSSLLAGQSIGDHATIALATPTAGDRVAMLARRAAAEAIAQAGWSEATLSDPRTALVVATSKGEVVAWITPSPHGAENSRVTGGPQPSGVASVDAVRAEDKHIVCNGPQPSGVASVAAAVATDLGMTGPRLTVSAACAGGLQAIIRATVLLAAGDADRVLVVAAEASVHAMFLGSFGRMGVLARPEIGCRPFDARREGFLMAEAAAAVCVERDGDGVRIVRVALAGDAHHLTAPDPSGIALRRMLGYLAGDDPIDLVHAHATGTQLNDPVELAAIAESVGDPRRPPVVYSHKAALGHSLGAAGLVAGALNVLAHRHGVVPGNIHTTDPLAAPGCVLSPTPIRRTIGRSLLLANGFG